MRNGTLAMLILGFVLAGAGVNMQVEKEWRGEGFIVPWLLERQAVKNERAAEIDSVARMRSEERVAWAYHNYLCNELTTGQVEHLRRTARAETLWTRLESSLSGLEQEEITGFLREYASHCGMQFQE